MTWAFWGTEAWQRYSDEYGGGHAGNDSSANLIVPIRDELSMFKALSKGHRADVRRAEREGVRVDILTGQDLPREMGLFRSLHAKDAGRITRSPETWEIQRYWVWARYAALVLAHEGDDQNLLAAALFITYGSRAYYASAARDPERADRRASHLILWETMCWLSRKRYTELDMGPVGDGMKAEGIASFKKHFGAHVRVAT